MTGCVRHRDLDLGNNRYMVSMQGNQYRGIGAVEQSFYQHAQEVATAHGFDSFRVLDIRSGFEPTPTGFQPFTKGTIQLYNGPKVGADGKPVRPAGGMSTGTAFAVNPDGVLLTNAHVAQECREITLRRFDGTIIPASLLAADRTNDLALVKTTSPTPEFAQFRGSPDIRKATP
ncbi:MAG TPA: serine protease [Stellaceae bacterium]|nr:serine protease [Stellaceae bacterium]